MGVDTDQDGSPIRASLAPFSANGAHPSNTSEYLLCSGTLTVAGGQLRY